MPEHRTEATALNPMTQELRVAVVIPGERRLISHGSGAPSFFVDPIDEENTFNVEKRVTYYHSRQRHHGLPSLTIQNHLGSHEGVFGATARPVTGSRVDLASRRFAMRAFTSAELAEAVEVAERNPAYMNHTDLVFLKRAIERGLFGR